MRMQLFETLLINRDERIRAYVVAPHEQRAFEIIVEHQVALSRHGWQVICKRVDRQLAPESRIGLDALLENAPAGFASFCSGMGWVPHVTSAKQLRLFRINEHEGEARYVIAPSAEVATAVYCSCLPVKASDPSLLQIADGLAHLSGERIFNLPELLEFGPVGIVEFDEEHGWLMW